MLQQQFAETVAFIYTFLFNESIQISSCCVFIMFFHHLIIFSAHINKLNFKDNRDIKRAKECLILSTCTLLRAIGS